MVWSTDYTPEYPASSVLILGKEDGWLDNDKRNYWLAETKETIGQGFKIKLDTCARWIAGVQIKNLRGGRSNTHSATKGFRVTASVSENGETLVQDELDDTRNKPASLLNFTFKEPVKIRFIKFELLSYWGEHGGGLQYFAAIPVASKQHTKIIICMIGRWAYD